MLRTADPANPKFQDLVASMRADGWWPSKPCEVTREGNHYVIVDGASKLAAARVCGLKKAVISITADLNDADRLARSLTANATVVDTRPVEYGRALQTILTAHPGWTFVELSSQVRKPVEWIQSRLNLTGLTGEAADLVNTGKISIANGQALVRAQRAGIEVEPLLERAQQEPSSEFVPDVDALRKQSKGPVFKLRKLGDIKDELARAQRDKKTPAGYVEALEWVLSQDPTSLGAKKSA
jgi:ParB-like chromosome segregation protein Spo0J